MGEHSLLYSFQISEDAASALQKLPACIDEVNPVPERRRTELRYNIRDLWRSLTMERAHRTIDYLNNPAFFSAYLRYFMPWNLVRLVALLTELPLELSADATIIDMGSGPLTFPLALYCAKPEFRKAPLTFICADRTPRIMEAGRLILELLAAKHGGELPPWKIELRHARFGEPLHEKASLFCAVNVFNEFFWHHEGILSEDASELYHRTAQYCAPQGKMLIVEPGEPRSGGLVSAMRAAAIIGGNEILAPCPHAYACPMPGIFKSGQEYLIGHHRTLEPVRMPAPRAKYPWCHFSVPAGFAPRWLTSLSEEAGLSKEKLSFSFLFVKKQSVQKKPSGGHLPIHDSSHMQSATVAERAAGGLTCRIISDSIALPGGRTGKYACSSLGYTLISADQNKTQPESGVLLRFRLTHPRGMEPRGSQQEALEFDRKTGAVLISY
ncbi:putative Small ribosomal subunit Rsm22 family [uncultured spirochete]|uniref:Putative Small ribosomal subunit Rsm22 family n=1 Tax=uncultured spirochete TaxID=156406 RepID=A0A3P3XME3_9SPIR|nr:putative Small ribosomal subunit Rsm22 family [uncultured spirochete]